MHLDSIKLTNFKNIASAEVSCCAKINCITGENGTGKTSLLDAIHYLSMTKSYFNSSDLHAYRYGETVTAITGTYIKDDGTTEHITVSLKKGEEKQVKRGQKAYRKFSEHIGLIPIVMTSSYDISLINDSGEERRKFLNTILSQVSRDYLQNLQHYNQLLLYRNKLLKEENLNADFLETLNVKMAGFAGKIFEERRKLCLELAATVPEFYQIISGGRESVTLVYSSDLENSDFQSLMEKNLEKDRVLGFTSAGVHRDDIKFMLNGHSIRNCGSQGQQKTFTLSLKLAQFKIMKSIYGFSPILLLDDVFDKLDIERVSKIIALVSGPEYGQIFITDSNDARLHDIVRGLNSEYLLYTAKDGTYTRN